MLSLPVTHQNSSSLPCRRPLLALRHQSCVFELVAISCPELWWIPSLVFLPPPCRWLRNRNWNFHVGVHHLPPSPPEGQEVRLLHCREHLDSLSAAPLESQGDLTVALQVLLPGRESVCFCLQLLLLLFVPDPSALLLTAEPLVRVVVQGIGTLQVPSCDLSSCVNCSCTLDRSIPPTVRVDVYTVLGLPGFLCVQDQY